MLLDPSKLQLDVKPEENIIIRDNISKDIVGVVIRQFGNDSELVNWAGNISFQSTKCAKSVRVSNF